VNRQAVLDSCLLVALKFGLYICTRLTILERGSAPGTLLSTALVKQFKQSLLTNVGDTHQNVYPISILLCDGTKRVHLTPSPQRRPVFFCLPSRPTLEPVHRSKLATTVFGTVVVKLLSACTSWSATHNLHRRAQTATVTLDSTIAGVERGWTFQNLH
jgi:hypothetical protein